MNRLVNLNNIDLNKVAVFCQVVDSGNYRLASESLNVTPSALSQTITSLEHALGLALFHRVGKRLVPTVSGIKLHKEFRTYHSGFMQALENLAEKQDKVAGLLTVGAYMEFAKSQLTPLVSEFLKRHPETQIKFVFDTPTRLHQLVEKGKIDLCFSIYPAVESTSIESTRVYLEELVLIAPKSLLGDSLALDYDDVVGLPMVEYYFNHQPIRRWLALHYKKRPRKLPIRAYASSAEMVLALVKSGLGIGIVPQYLLASADEKAALRIVRPTAKRFMDHIWMLQRKGLSRSPAHVAFSRFAIETFRTTSI